MGFLHPGKYLVVFHAVVQVPSLKGGVVERRPGFFLVLELFHQLEVGVFDFLLHLLFQDFILGDGFFLGTVVTMLVVFVVLFRDVFRRHYPVVGAPLLWVDVGVGLNQNLK